MKKILIINTGGTFSSVKSAGGPDAGAGGEHDILEELKVVAKDCQLEYEDFCSLDSANIMPRHWAELAARIEEASREYSGIVVIHGTDTMSYTASDAVLYALGSSRAGGDHRKPALHRPPGGGCHGRTAGRPYTWPTAAAPGCSWHLTAESCWGCGRRR